MDLKPLCDRKFDLVCSTNGFFVWIADLRAVFEEIFRILKPGGHYVFYDVHPFQRPWKDGNRSIEVGKPYWQTGPLRDEKEGTFEFNWTLGELMNPLADTGFVLGRILERPAEDSSSWEGSSYTPGKNDGVARLEGEPQGSPAVLAFGGSATTGITPGGRRSCYGERTTNDSGPTSRYGTGRIR